jgi:polar amino acid transport system substrate-binding protein
MTKKRAIMKKYQSVKEGRFMNALKKSLSCFISIILMCFIMSNVVFAQKTLTVAVNANWPPMQMKDSKGNVSGYEIDLLKAIAAEAGFKFKLVNVSWRNIFNDLAVGKYDAVMASVSITDARKEKFDFSDPYFTAEQILLVPKAKLNAQLAGKTMAVFKLTTGAEAVRSTQGCNISYYTVEETAQAFKDLSKGFVDGILCDSPVAYSYAAKYSGKFALKSDACALAKKSANEEYGIVVKKGDSETVSLMNKGLKVVKDKGIEAKIKDKWFKEIILASGAKKQDSMLASEIMTGPQNSPASSK